MALALLKAEEEEGKERLQSESSIVSSEDLDRKSVSDTEVSVAPKLTRLKAKLLNHQLPILGNLLESHEPDEEVVKLIQEDLKSDDGEHVD